MVHTYSTKFIANYIKGRKAYTSFRNITSTQHQFKISAPQGDVLSPTVFNVYTTDISTLPKHTQLITYSEILLSLITLLRYA